MSCLFFTGFLLPVGSSERPWKAEAKSFVPNPALQPFEAGAKAEILKKVMVELKVMKHISIVDSAKSAGTDLCIA